MKSKCDVCKENEAKYSIGNGKKKLCRECLIAEYGLCAICANDCKDHYMAVELCSDFEESTR